MNQIQMLKGISKHVFTLAALATCFWLAGCAFSGSQGSGTAELPNRLTQGAESRLRIGDPVSIRFDTGGGLVSAPQSLDTVLDEHGEISLTLIGPTKVEGLTPSELAKHIQSLYVPRFYVRCNVTVSVSGRFFYTSGELSNKGRHPWAEEVSLLKAIDMAGGFTDFANRHHVEVTRGTKKIVVDAEEARRNPAKDIPILPGDSIWVPRSFL